jgi:hypothetical protein
MCIQKSIKSILGLEENESDLGSLDWRSPGEFRSFRYVQSGFEFNKKNGQDVLSLSKFADIPITVHRKIPDNLSVKEISIKKERTGE